MIPSLKTIKTNERLFIIIKVVVDIKVILKMVKKKENNTLF